MLYVYIKLRPAFGLLRCFSSRDSSSRNSNQAVTGGVAGRVSEFTTPVNSVMFTSYLKFMFFQNKHP